VLGVSGLLLDFPNFGQGLELLQLSHLFHTIAGVTVRVRTPARITPNNAGQTNPE